MIKLTRKDFLNFCNEDYYKKNINVFRDFFGYYKKNVKMRKGYYPAILFSLIHKKTKDSLIKEFKTEKLFYYKGYF